jgi:hypothetical protein
LRASITLIRGEVPFTAAHDGQMALDADELQYERGYGPCVDAGRAGQCSWSTTCGPNSAGLTTPSMSPRTAYSLAVGAPAVPRRRHRCAEHLRRTSRGLRRAGCCLSRRGCAWVAVAVGNVEATARSSEDLTHLRTAVMSRAFIEQAKGILMERHKITEDEAFTILAHASQRTNTKLRDVAAALVRTGASPS